MTYMTYMTYYFLVHLYPGIQKPVHDICRGVDHHIGRRDHQYAPLRELVIPLAYAVHQQTPNSRPRENPLGDYRPGQQHSELEPKDRHDGYQAVLQDVLVDH